ncbi:MAG: ABC transporter substrate-binding protein [Sphingobacteriales bacterium]|jgi:putative ABC transport system substrate-binding protein
MRRREFFALVGAAATWPLVVRAQQQALPVIGFLHYGSPDKLANLAEAVRQGLQETGYVDRQNVTIMYRWAEGHYDRLPTLAAELVHRRVNVIVAGGNAAAHAAKNATAAIPVVFTSGADPVYSGLVTSLSRPEGNLTGSSIIAQAMGAKRLELIHELLPLIRTVAMIINPKFAGAESEYEEVDAAGRAMKLQILRFTASSNDEVDTAFGTIHQQDVNAVIVGTDGYLITRRDQLAALATRYKIPTMYPFPAFAEAGGLISYGPSLRDGYRQAGVYVGRILKGAKPADLPVIQPTKFDLVVNLKAAKAIGLVISPMLLTRADQVIE